MCGAELEAGELVPLVPDYQLDAVEIHAVYPAGRRPSIKVRTFADYLATKLVTADGSSLK
jgi:DNA-binding transcriptional LysR family regulator